MGKFRRRKTDDTAALLLPRKNGIFGKRVVRSEDFGAPRNPLHAPPFLGKEHIFTNNMDDEYLPATVPSSPDLDVIVLATPSSNQRPILGHHEEDDTTVSNLTESRHPQERPLTDYKIYAPAFESNDPKQSSMCRYTVIEKVLGLMEEACNSDEQTKGLQLQRKETLLPHWTIPIHEHGEESSAYTGQNHNTIYSDDGSIWRFIDAETMATETSKQKIAHFKEAEKNHHRQKTNEFANLSSKNRCNKVAACDNNSAASYENFEIILGARNSTNSSQGHTSRSIDEGNPIHRQIHPEVVNDGKQEEKKEDFYEDGKEYYCNDIVNYGKDNMYKHVFGAGLEEVASANDNVRLVGAETHLDRIEETSQEDDQQSLESERHELKKPMDDSANAITTRKKIIKSFVKRFSYKNKRNQSEKLRPSSPERIRKRVTSRRMKRGSEQAAIRSREQTQEPRSRGIFEQGVRVPGLKGPDKFINDDELLGEEVLEDISGEIQTMQSKDKKEAQDDGVGNEDTDDESILSIRRVNTGPDPQCRGEMDRESVNKDSLGIRASCAITGDLSDDIALTRLRSAPTKLGSPEKTKRPKKPKWKSAVDPSSGRTYYYHRVTRETTWVKPPDFEMQPTKTKRPTEVKTNSFMQDQATKFRKKTQRDFDPVVWKTKQQILELLRSISLPEGADVEKLLEEYEGKELQLLRQLHELVESKPFDEPFQAPQESLSVASSAKQSVPFVRTAVSAATKKSEMTETTAKICNTARKISALDLVESKDSHLHSAMSTATSISSAAEELNDEVGRETQKVVVNYNGGRIPSKLPVTRSRDLKVEEFPVDRIAHETYNDINGSLRSSLSTPKLVEQVIQPSMEMDDCSYYEDFDETIVSQDTALNSKIADSISALSETDADFEVQKDNFERARRRALDVAVEREDWDLAAALSEGMRQVRENFYNTKFETSEWTQTELDRFISENDWDAVGKYIAHMRDSGKQREINRTTSEINKEILGEGVAKSNANGLSARKKFGARSQLQHGDIRSVSSHSTKSGVDSAGSFGGDYEDLFGGERVHQVEPR